MPKKPKDSQPQPEQDPALDLSSPDRPGQQSVISHPVLYNYVDSGGDFAVRNLEFLVPSTPPTLTESLLRQFKDDVLYALGGESSSVPALLANVLAMPSSTDPARLVGDIIREGRVPSHQLYRTVKGYQLWLEICYSELARTYKDSVSQVSAQARTFLGDIDLERAAEHGVRLVELGVGTGEKTAFLLRALGQMGCKKVDVDLVDVSHGMIGHAMQNVLIAPFAGEFPPKMQLNAYGMSFEDYMRKCASSDRSPDGPQTIFSLLGLTVGNFKVRDIFKFLREISTIGDLLFIDYQRYERDDDLQSALVQSYNSDRYREFALGSVRAIVDSARVADSGADACDFSLDDVHVEFKPQGSESVGITEVVFTLKEEAFQRFQKFVHAHVGDSFELPSPLVLHFSHKFTERDFNIRLRKRGKFEPTGHKVLLGSPQGMDYQMLVARRDERIDDDAVADSEPQER